MQTLTALAGFYVPGIEERCLECDFDLREHVRPNLNCPRRVTVVQVTTCRPMRRNVGLQSYIELSCGHFTMQPHDPPDFSLVGAETSCQRHVREYN
jgi:hypothetical protein